MNRDDDDDLQEIDVELIHESDAAWLVRDGFSKEAWLPKSQVEFPPNAEEGETVTVTVSEWLLTAKGIG